MLVVVPCPIYKGIVFLCRHTVFNAFLFICIIVCHVTWTMVYGIIGTNNTIIFILLGCMYGMSLTNVYINYLHSFFTW